MTSKLQVGDRGGLMIFFFGLFPEGFISLDTEIYAPYGFPEMKFPKVWILNITL